MRTPSATARSRAALLVGGALLACAACSVEKHYRTLSFFFDGVPDPSQPHAPHDEPPPAAPAAPVASPPPASTGSMHPPVRERKCEECHRLEGQAPARGSAGWMLGVPELVVPVEELCARCHQAPAKAQVHGPADAGLCALCHLPHQSAFPHLLRQERQESLCTRCHRDSLFVSAERHATFGGQDCVVCHDPHSADESPLLRPGWQSHLPPADDGSDG